MSVIDEVQKLSEDCLALELRELSLRLDVLECVSQGDFAGNECTTGQRKAINSRFDEAERRASERHSQTLKALELLADAWGLRERLAGFEPREKER